MVYVPFRKEGILQTWSAWGRGFGLYGYVCMICMSIRTKFDACKMKDMDIIEESNFYENLAIL
jgi:hypothetical protein